MQGVQDLFWMYVAGKSQVSQSRDFEKGCFPSEGYHRKSRKGKAEVKKFTIKGFVKPVNQKGIIIKTALGQPRPSKISVWWNKCNRCQEMGASLWNHAVRSQQKIGNHGRRYQWNTAKNNLNWRNHLILGLVTEIGNLFWREIAKQHIPDVSLLRKWNGPTQS